MSRQNNFCAFDPMERDNDDDLIDCEAMSTHMLDNYWVEIMAGAPNPQLLPHGYVTNISDMPGAL